MRFKFDRLTPTGLIRLVAEVVLLFLVAWAPWPFASVEYAWEAILIGGTALLVLLWIAYAFFQGQLVIRPDRLTGCLAALVILSLFQLIPLPESIVGILSPMRVQLHHQLLPDTLELLPGETAAVPRASWIPLTFDPFLTRVFLAQMLALLLLYFVVRSWLSSRESLRRLAWVCTINGILLAIVGLAQFFSTAPSRNIVFWSVETEGAVFGPFICKNHFPDYVLFCLGLGFGLLVSRQGPSTVKVRGVEYRLNVMSRLTDSPDLFILGSGLILMIVSIPFTLSRGGLLASGIAVAAVVGLTYRTRGKLTRGAAIGGVLIFLALLLGAWFGWGIVSDRLGTLWSGKSGQAREGLWSDVITLIPSFFAVGGGDGAFPRFETITRQEAGPENYVMNNAHNEYLEAILEGGLLRFAITLLIAYTALRYAVLAYLKLKDRSSGPLLLGIFFGIVGLISHSFVDFGIHMPAIAFLAAVMAAYAADAATDPTYIPFKKKSLDAPKPDPGRRPLSGTAMVAISGVLAAASVWLVFDASNRGQAEQWKLVARQAERNGGLDQYKVRLEALTAATVRTPSDAIAWSQLAQAHFEAANDEHRNAAMALGGVPAVVGFPFEVFIAPQGEQVKAGLEAARTARGCSPLLTRPHIFLAQFADGFAKSEQARTHFDRALRTCPTDPDIYILRGNDAARKSKEPSEKDLKLAIEDWQKAMKLNPQKVPEVLVAASRVMGPEQILSQLLPSDPALIWAAVEQLHPVWRPDGGRKPFLDRIVRLDGREDWKSAGAWAAIGRAHAELGDGDAAFAAWQKAIAREPDSFNLRNDFSRWLEADERYDAAEAQLQWLRDHHDSKDLLDRLELIRHARKLKAIIEGP